MKLEYLALIAGGLYLLSSSSRAGLSSSESIVSPVTTSGTGPILSETPSGIYPVLSIAEVKEIKTTEATMTHEQLHQLYASLQSQIHTLRQQIIPLESSRSNLLNQIGAYRASGYTTSAYYASLVERKNEINDLLAPLNVEMSRLRNLVSLTGKQIW